MKTIYSLIVSMLLIVCANAQKLDYSNPRLLLNDHADEVTCVNYNNLSSPYAGYWTYTGGTQNTCAQSADNNVTISSKYARSGNNSYRHYVKYTGNNNGQWGRGEWGVLNPGTQTIENQWRWAAISILIDPNHAFESRRYQIAFDHKEAPDDQETPLYLAILGTRYVLYGRFVDDPYVDLGPVETGVWVDWLLERNWSTGSDGYMRFYKNGQLMWQRLNQPNRDGRSGSAAICRIQHGFYKWAWYAGNPEGQGSGNTTGDLIMYSDEIKFGGVNATFADMQPGALTAPPPTQNTAPTAQSGSNITITLPSNSVTLNGTGSDPDGSISDYTWTKVSGPGGGAIQNADAATTQITGLQAGTYVYRLTVTDDDGATAQDDITITVNEAAAPPPPVNVDPQANAGTNKTITLPVNTVTLNGGGTDTDGTIADYTWTKVSGPAGGAIGNADASSTDVTGLQEGTYVYRLTVTDDDGATSTDDVQVTVNAGAAPPPNAAPVSTAGTNQVITLPRNTVTLNGSGTDSDGSIADYTWTKVSGPAGGTIGSADAASTGISGLQAGTYVFRLTVTDNDGGTDSDDIIVVVNPEPTQAANQPPAAAAGGDITIRLPISAVTLNGSGADADGQIASYRWTKVSGPASGNFQAAGQQSTGYNSLTAGVYVVRLTVTDDDGATDFDEVQITVRAAANSPQPPANEAPSANAGADIRITLPVNSATLNGVGTDVDGTIASYNWTKLSGPAAGTIVNPAAQSTGVTNLVEGVYEFRLTISDNSGAKSSDDVRVTVKKAANVPANQAPSATAGSDRVIVLPVSTVNLRGNAVDADGSVVSYNWKKMSGPTSGTIQADASQGTSVVDLKEGEYVFRFTVKDDKGASGSDELRVTVKAAAAPLPNQLPVADAGTDITVTFPVTGATLNGSNSSDPDGTIASYRWVMVKGPVTGTLSNGNSPNATLTELVEGVYEFELTVFDNDGGSSVDRVLVTVTGNNTRPVVIVSDTMTVYLPAQNTQLDASQSYDTDGTIRSYEWTRVSGPGNPGLLSPAAGKTIVTDLVAGTYRFSITITDNDGSVSKAFVTVVVKNSTARRLIPVVNLYPNPAETNVTLTIDSEVSGKADLVVYDMLGRPVMRESFNKTSRTIQRKLNISNLADGMYAIELSIDQAEKVVRKFVKQ